MVLAGSLFAVACSTQAGDEQAIPTAPADEEHTGTSAGLPENPASGWPGDSDPDGQPSDQEGPTLGDSPMDDT